ncbi:MAG: hypothetical protein V7L01_06520 [Nostoc sp.]|uniref:hypothetical protein n=1 Tax=Nostoc sp. TaxID=1180 RepID=UPI002FF714D2
MVEGGLALSIFRTVGAIALRGVFQGSGGFFFAYETLGERSSCQREQRDFAIIFEIFCVIAKFVAFWDDTA